MQGMQGFAESASPVWAECVQLSRREEAAAPPSYAQAAARRSVPAATTANDSAAPADAPPAESAPAAAAGGDHRLRFSLSGVQLSQSSTIFQAIQSGQRSRPPAAGLAGREGEDTLPQPQARRLWDEVHTVHYCRCALAWDILFSSAGCSTPTFIFSSFMHATSLQV